MTAETHPELASVETLRPAVADGVTVPAGSRGAIVHVYADGGPYIVEFVRDDGRTWAIADYPHNAVRVYWRPRITQ